MTETARMYGGSLYDLAAEEGLEARILGELDEAVALFKANPDYLHLLSTPSIPKKERCGLLDEALRDQVHLYVLNFLKILCEKGTLRELSGCARAYRVRYNQAHGILEATATTAVAMTEQQAKSLHEKLEKLNRQDHRPENKGRSGSAGRHPAGYRRHRAGRHGAEPSGGPAQGHCFRDTVIEFPPERFLRIEW